jgi:hypothetical protein
MPAFMHEKGGVLTPPFVFPVLRTAYSIGSVT